MRDAEARRAGRELYGEVLRALDERERELEETERKFRAFLDSLRWG